jgi:hypothetical protein
VLQFEEAIRREGPETVAAVIVEPVMNVEGLVIRRSYFETLRQICDKYGVLLIYDEIITGFGRTGTLFFAEQAGAWPDMLCVGKGMSGGYAPLAATIVSDKVSEAFWGEPEDRVQYNGGHTFAGNPLARAAGLAVLDYIEERDLLSHVARSTVPGRKAVGARRLLPSIVDVRGIGLWWESSLSEQPDWQTRRRDRAAHRKSGAGARVGAARRAGHGFVRAAADYTPRRNRRDGRPSRAGDWRRNRIMSGLFSLEGQVALVTGAGRGIGQAIAAAFAQAGADVAVASRTESELQTTAERIQAAGRARSSCRPTFGRSAAPLMWWRAAAGRWVARSVGHILRDDCPQTRPWRSSEDD